jgi:hypothetical protein
LRPLAGSADTSPPTQWARSDFTSSEVASPADQPALASLQELRDTLLAAEFGNAGFASQPFKDDADLLLGRTLPAGCSADVSDRLLGAVGACGSCSHRCLLRLNDEPDPLLYSISSICPVGPDGGHSAYEFLYGAMCVVDSVVYPCVTAGVGVGDGYMANLTPCPF